LTTPLSNQHGPLPPGYHRSVNEDPYTRWVLIVVDAQHGFDDPAWGARNNPSCDNNIAALVDDWSNHDRPLVYVRHDSTEAEAHLPSAVLTRGSPGNELRDYLGKAKPDLLVSKHVNSAFHGSPDLHAWLLGQKAAGIVVCGITTDHCCETTVRVGANLGHDVLFPIDATFTFDRRHPDGTMLTADEITRATAASLHGEFANVTTTAEVLAGRAGPID
jgi:nicotinamidase-related amidase